MGELVSYRKRRTTELLLCLVAWAIATGGYLEIYLNQTGALPAAWPYVCGGWLALCVGAHLVVRFAIPYADPVILPCALALNGLGLAMIHRIDLGFDPTGTAAQSQSMWTVLGVICFSLVLIWLRDYHRLQGLSYVLFIFGMVLLLLPMVPGLSSPNNAANGSQIWIQVAGYSFQPAEIAKIVLTLAFASYLTDNRELLQLAGRAIGPIRIPRLRDLIPVGIMWGASLLVLVFENDLGTSLLFFSLFVVMLYVSTTQVRWVVIALGAFAAACLVVGRLAPHVATRISSWLDPFSDYDLNYQVITAQFGIAWGGLFGRGWGQGRPGLTPVASSDFISAAIAEELGVVGIVACLLIYLLLVSRGLRAALTTEDTFGKLLAAGFSFVTGLQVFVIVGGVTRLLPLTGLTTPFMSQGGSSLIANWIIAGILMLVSHEARRPRVETTTPDGYSDLSNEGTQLIDMSEVSR